MENTSRHPVTLRDIARATGVHFSTVSLVLTGSCKVAAKTRERVLRAAKRLKYHRDPVFHALSARRALIRNPQPRPLIAFITNRPTMAGFEIAPHMPAFLAGAQAQAQAMGFSCELMLIGDPSIDLSRLDEELHAKGARGVILAAFLPEPKVPNLDWSRYAVVKIDSWFMPPDVARISHDQLQIVRRAFEALHKRGYRRIGMAVGQFDEDGFDELYRTGYLLEQHLRAEPMRPPLHFNFEDSTAECAKKLRRWIRKYDFDVVISNWGNIHELLTLAGLEVPKDIACASLCLNQDGSFFAGTISPHRMVGQKAVEMIALLIKNQQFGVPSAPTCLYVAPEWHDGPSAPVRAATA